MLNQTMPKKGYEKANTFFVLLYTFCTLKNVIVLSNWNVSYSYCLDGHNLSLTDFLVWIAGICNDQSN